MRKYLFVLLISLSFTTKSFSQNLTFYETKLLLDMEYTKANEWIINMGFHCINSGKDGRNDVVVYTNKDQTQVIKISFIDYIIKPQILIVTYTLQDQIKYGNFIGQIGSEYKSLKVPVGDEKEHASMQYYNVDYYIYCDFYVNDLYPYYITITKNKF